MIKKNSLIHLSEFFYILDIHRQSMERSIYVVLLRFTVPTHSLTDSTSQIQTGCAESFFLL